MHATPKGRRVIVLTGADHWTYEIGEIGSEIEMGQVEGTPTERRSGSAGSSPTGFGSNKRLGC